ncbi:MAG: FG-GAP repeat protein [Solirubrobacteraceae bacterium]|nr:FG-GAP repeat protein [Solirubrobacteraceae bacterium]
MHASSCAHPRTPNRLGRAPAIAALALAGALLAPAGATAATTTKTVDLQAEFVLRVDGVAKGDQFGDRVANAGNRDGRAGDELVAGAINFSSGRRSGAGAAFVFSPRRLISLPGRTVRIDKAPRVTRFVGREAGNSAGDHVAGVGDVNGDGMPDLAVTDGIGGDERAYLVLSTGGKTAIDLARRPKGVLEYPQASGPEAAGDFDGDGVDDIVDAIGPGYSEICFGARTWKRNSCSTRRVAIEGSGDEEGETSGAWGVGDVNGDELDDIALTTDNAVVVVFGRKDRPKKIEFAKPDFGGFVIGGATGPQTPGASFGKSVTGLGDVDGDGLDDLAIGAPTASAADRKLAGEITIVFGRRDTTPVGYPVPAELGARIVGGFAGDRAGWQVAPLGDGRIALSAFLAGGLGRVDAGVTYAVEVPARGQTTDLSRPGAADTRFVGAAKQDQSGYELDTADVDGDRKREIVIGAGFANNGARDAGSLYVVKG